MALPMSGVLHAFMLRMAFMAAMPMSGVLHAFMLRMVFMWLMFPRATLLHVVHDIPPGLSIASRG
jgi:hypothetical protein